MRQQKHPVQLAALLFFIHVTSVLSIPIPQANTPTNCATCHGFSGFQSTKGNEELYDNTGISRRQPRLAIADQEPDRNVGGTWFRRRVSQLAPGSSDKRNIDDGHARVRAQGWPSQDGDSTTETAKADDDFGLKSLKKRTDAAGWSVAEHQEYNTLKESGWNHRAGKATMVERGFITVDVAPEDLEAQNGLASKSVDERTDPAGWSFDEDKGDRVGETSGAHFYPSGSWRRRWKGQNIAGASADTAGADSWVGDRAQKRGLITADVVPTEDEQSGVQQGTCVTCTKRTVPDWDNVLPTEDSKGVACAGCVTERSALVSSQNGWQSQEKQSNQRRGFITVDVAPTEDGRGGVQQGSCITCTKWTVLDWDNVLATEDNKGGACADCVTKRSRLASSQTTSQSQDEQAKQKKRFITVDVAPIDEGTADVQQGDCPSCLKKRAVAD